MDRVDEPLLTDLQEEDLEKTMVMTDLKKEVSEKMAKQPTEKTKRRRKTNTGKKFGFLNSAILVSFSIFLAGAMLLYFIIIYHPAHSKVAEVYIPDVTQKTLKEAEQELKKLNLKYGKVIYIEDEEYKDGDIFKTSPAVGTRVKVKSNVTLYVAKEPEKEKKKTNKKE